MRIQDAGVERLSREEITALQQRRVLSLVTKVSKENPFYREQWAKAGPSRIQPQLQIGTEPASG